MIKDKATVRVKFEVEDWGNTWRKALNEMAEGISEIENINSTSMSASEKYKRMLDIKLKYDFECVPVDIIEAALLPEVTNLKGVVMERLEQGVKLKLDHLEVTFKLGYNSGIWCQDTSDYLHAYHSLGKTSKEDEILIGWLQKYVKKEVNRNEMTKGLLDEYEEHCKNVGAKYSRTYTKKAFDTIMKDFQSVLSKLLKRKEQYENEEKEIERAEESNKARDKKRKRMLVESGLRDFLISFEKQGIILQSSGIISEEFMEEV